MAAFDGWDGMTPPLEWKRVLAMDVGGATPNNLEWAAVCPDTQTLVFYDEVNLTTTDMREIALRALPKMKAPSGIEYQFTAKVVDYENRVAADDMARYGIRFSNAIKHDKTTSIQRLAGYLHPNPARPYPKWHPKAGRLGAPLLFITEGCPRLIHELPLQKWKNDASGASMKDEMDRNIRHDAVDCALYIARVMPAPITIPIPKIAAVEDSRSLQSKLYWLDVKRMEERNKQGENRKPYSASHIGGGTWKSLSGYSG